MHSQNTCLAEWIVTWEYCAQTVVYEKVMVIAAAITVKNFFALEQDRGALGVAMTERRS